MFAACSEKRIVSVIDDKQKSSLTRSPPLTMDDVTYQGRMLMNDFIHDRMLQDGIANAPVVSDLQEPGTPCGNEP